MKLWVVLGAMLAGANLFALTSLPDGQWQGKGRFQNEAGMHGTYTETMTIKDNTMTNELVAEGMKALYVIKAEFKANNFVSLTVEDKTRNETIKGQGYCGTGWCHLVEDGNKFEMTVIFAKDKVFELGASVEQDTKGWFESVLKKVTK